MISLTCSQCGTVTEVAETKLGTRTFLCTKCFTPLDAPSVDQVRDTTLPMEPAPKPAITEQETVAASEVDAAKIQAALRKLAEPAPAVPKAEPVAKPIVSVAAPPPKPATVSPAPREQANASPVLAWVAGISVLAMFAALGIFAMTRDRTPVEVAKAPEPVEKPQDPKPEPVQREPQPEPKVAPKPVIPMPNPPPPIEKKKSEKVEAKKKASQAALAVAQLEKTLKDGTLEQKQKALADLPQHGFEARKPLPLLLDLLKDPELAGKTEETLAKLGPPQSSEVPIYATALQEEHPGLRVHAIGALGKLGASAKSELLLLRGLAFDPDPMIQQAAEKAVQTIEEQSVVAAIKALKDKSVNVRLSATQELAEMGMNAKPALPNLVDALNDANSAIRVASVEAMLAIGPDAIMVLGEAVRDPKVSVRISAIHALGKMGADATPVLPEILQAMNTKDQLVLDEAVTSLARIGAYSVPAILKVLPKEKDGPRKQSLIVALERIGPEAMMALKAAQKAAEPEVKKVVDVVLQKVQLAPMEPIKDLKGNAGLIQGQLRGWFLSVDLNHDESLTKDELARAVRGPTAKPFDAPTTGTVKTLSVKDYAVYPDFAFLNRTDRDGDGVVSRYEFEKWALEYAGFLNEELDAQRKLQDMQRKVMQKALSAQVRLQTHAALQSSWSNYHAWRRGQGHLAHMEWMQRHILAKR